MDRVWSEAELAYFAGIVDGEGCFAVHRHRQAGIYGMQLQVGNTDPQLMQWMHQRFGGTLKLERRANPKHQPVWRWWAASADLDVLLTRLIPYLICKKRQAELFVAYRATRNATVRTSHSTTKTTAAVKRERARIHTELAALKRPHIVAVSA
jgi:cytochrome c-type biogenesis protein CcmH/NrfF